jgi:hypothetical protein
MDFETFNNNILIVMTTYNRMDITKICLKNIHDNMGSATLWIYDDYSTEYTIEDLKRIAPKAEIKRAHKKLGIERLRLQIQKDASNTGHKFIYHIDNDAYHDPNWIARIHDIYSRYPRSLIGLYNTKHHFHRTIEKIDDVIKRQACPGISFFFDKSILGEIPDKLYNSWDFVFGDKMKPAIISDISYVEHFGANGIHNKTFDSDVAFNPTDWLKSERKRIIESLTSK